MTDFFNLPSKAGQDAQNQYLAVIAQHLGVTAGNLQDAINMANQANQAATAKITDLETRFQRLTSQQQHDAEVIDARDGETSLRARLDRDHAEFASHMAEKVSQLIYVTRDISLDGVQIITGLIGIPERIEIRAIITDWAKASISIGSWEKNGFAHSCYSILTTQSGGVISYSTSACDVQVFDDNLNYLKGLIQNVAPTQFEILWKNDNTSPSGTVDLQIIVYYHGGN